jgi:hypothetical protein
MLPAFPDSHLSVKPSFVTCPKNSMRKKLFIKKKHYKHEQKTKQQ